MPTSASPARRPRRALLAGGALLVAAVTAATAPIATAHPEGQGGGKSAGNAGNGWFQRVSTMPAYTFDAAGEQREQTAVEISAASADGKTVVSTDSPAGRILFTDLRRLDAPEPLGHLDVGGEPTSVDVLGDRYALVAVNTSADRQHPGGELHVVDLRTRRTVRTLPLAGQPDSVDLSADGRYAAVAIENERDEDVDDGALPQAPGGLLQVVDVIGDDPADWTVRQVGLTGLADVAPQDPEPEYVSVNSRNQAVVTLQENNHLVVVDLAAGKVVKDFPAGSATVTGVDTVSDGEIAPTGTVTAAREPDGAAWIDDRYVATADEGDWQGGSRTWTVFDTRTGAAVFSSGRELEDLAIRHGQYPEKRAGKKGVEPENITVAVIDGTRYAFVALERANMVAVYDLTDPLAPKLLQGLPTAVGPEGVLAVPRRNALVVSSEEDSAKDGVRAALNVYRLTHRSQDAAPRANTAAPSIVAAGPGLGFGALSGLSGVPGSRHGVVAVTDSAYGPSRVLSVDTGRTPAVVTSALPVTKGGRAVSYDAEGVAARQEGGFWVASEGDGKKVPNLLVEVGADGAVLSETPLPTALTAGAAKYGLEGVAVTGEHVWLAVQREWAANAPGTTTLARYTPANGEWAYAAYPLERVPATAADGTWHGVSELTAVDGDTLLVLERDNRRGAEAGLKAVFRVDLGRVSPAATIGDAPVVIKRMVEDLLPALTADGSPADDKPEGLAITGAGALVGAVDNDGLDDAPGESVLLRLGRAPRH